MLYRDICRILGYYLLGLAAVLVVPLLLAAYYQWIADPMMHPQPHVTDAFFWSAALCLAVSFCCYQYGKHSIGHLYRREGLVAVVLIWFLTPVFAGLPFYLSGTLENPCHAFFEAASGFSTAGATTMQAKKYDPRTGQEIPIERVFGGQQKTIYSYYGTIKPVVDPATGKVLYEGIEAVGKALLFWRSFTQWLGGMGIVVLFVAILPALGIGGKRLFQAEIPGPIKDSLTPRIKETALQLWKIYLGLTAILAGLLLATNHEMNWLEVATVTLSTISTGGFTTRNASIGAFDNPFTDWIVMIFMVLGSLNFSLYFFLLRGKFYRLYEPEFFLFIAILILGCGVVSWQLVGNPLVLLSGEKLGLMSIHDAIRYGSFQFISAMTTAGFATVNYDHWPYFVQVLMLVVMFIGGMSGSTAGGMKVIRQLMVFRIVQYKCESLFRPETLRLFKLGEKEVGPGASIMVLCYFVIVIAMMAFSTIFYVWDGIDPQTSLSLSTMMINNIGMGFRMASPMESCAFLSDFALLFSSLLMIFGRLEFLAVLAVMVPAFWQKNK